jgi:hypothetical protein
MIISSNSLDLIGMDWRITLFGPYGLLDAQRLLLLPSIPLVQNIVFLREKLLSSTISLSQQLVPHVPQLSQPQLSQPMEVPRNVQSMKKDIQALLWKKIRQALPPEKRYVRKTYYEVSMLYLFSEFFS